MVEAPPVVVVVVVIWRRGACWEAAAGAAGAAEEVIAVSPRPLAQVAAMATGVLAHRGRGRRWRAGPGAVVGIGEAPRAARGH